MSRTIGSPARDHPVRRLVMGRRRIRAGPDDGEVRLVVTLGDQPLADLARDVRLGPADQPARSDLGDDAVGGVGGLGQQRDLVGVLDDPQLGRGRVTRAAKRRPGRRSSSRSRCRAGQVVGDGDPTQVGRPCRPPATPRRADHRRDQRVRVVGLLPGHDRQDAGRRRRARRARASPPGAARRAPASPCAGMTSIVRRSSGIAG